jgi:DNA-binding NarL/FixJ family response regulator
VGGATATLERPERIAVEAVCNDGTAVDESPAAGLALAAFGDEPVPERPRISVAVVASSPAVRAGLVDFLERAGYAAVEAPAGPIDVLAEALDPSIDVVVADLDDQLGVEGADDVMSRVGELPVVLLASGLDADWDASSRRAATGWLRRDASAEELDAAVRAVAAGLDVVAPDLRGALLARAREPDEPSPLTEREREVLELVASGLPNKGIARALGISEHTVKFHVGAVLSKLEAQSRTEAVSIAARRGLMTL